MTSKSDPRERRLKSIYDALDSGNNKKAVQEADKALRKDPGALCAKALKALALFRAGRNDEAASVSAEVESCDTCDEPVLQAMTYVYKESHRPHGIVGLYERAVKLQPKSEELLTSLFMAYVRVMDYKSQQLTAARLHRLQPQKSPYYFWTVMSLLMQADKCQDRRLADTMLLPLAAKMAEAHKDKMEADAEVHLYLMILERQQRFEDCLRELDGSLGQLFPDYSLCWVQRQRRHYLEQLHRTDELLQQLQLALEREPNDWSLWRQCVETTVRLRPERVAQLADRLASLLADSRQQQQQPPAMLLAQLHLLAECSNSSSNSNLLSPACELLGDPLLLARDYFETFRTKPSAAADLLLFRSLFASREAELLQLLLPLRPQLPGGEENGGDSEDAGLPAAACDDVSAEADGQARRRLRHRIAAFLNYEQLRRGLGQHASLTPAAREQLLQQLVSAYRRCQLSGLQQTEPQPADDLLLMAVSLLYDSWLAAGCGEQQLYRALYLLDEGLTASPSNHCVIVWMVRLFSSLGAWLPASSLFERLDVKQILLEGLGYLLTRQVSRMGQLSQGLVLLNSTAAFYKSCCRDIAEQLCTAYRVGNFRKVPEMDELSSRVTVSLESHFCNTEMRYVSLLLSGPKIVEGVYEMGADPASDVVDFDSLVDARDFGVVRDFAISSSTTLADDTANEVAWLQFRSLGLRCLSNAARVATELAAGAAAVAKQADNSCLLLRLLAEFKHTHLPQEAQHGDLFKVQPHPCLPQPTCLAAHLSLGTVDLLSAITEFLLDLPQLPQLQRPIDIVDRQLKLAAESTEQFGCLLQRLCLLCESVCLLTLAYELAVVGLSHRLAAAKKQRRQVEQHCRSLRQAVATKTEEAERVLQKRLDQCKEQVGQHWATADDEANATTEATGQEEAKAAAVGAAPQSVAKVAENVCQSRYRSLAEMLNLLQVKARLSDPVRQAAGN